MCTECKLVCLLRPGDPRTGCAVSSLFLLIRNHLQDEQLSALYATIEGQRALEVVDGHLAAGFAYFRILPFWDMRSVPVICAVKFYVSRRASQLGMTSIIMFADRSNIPSEMTLT